MKKTITDEKDMILTPAGPVPRQLVRVARPGQAVVRREDGSFELVDRGAPVEDTPAASQQPWVITPGGYRDRSKVHLVEPGYVVSGAGNRLLKMHFLGSVAADLGPLIPRPEGPLMPRNVSLTPLGLAPGLRPPTLGSGWIAYAYWLNASGHTITSFKTRWVVPAAPRTQSGQLIYLFNGIQNSTMIYQPVLQWGSNGAFGGNYWCVASWYADGQGGQATHSTAVQVSAGQVLEGVMTLTSQSGSNFSYNCQFTGIANSALPIQNVQELTWCAQTLEAYNVQKASDYPNADITAFGSINIQTSAGNPSTSWTGVNAVTDVGQHTVVVSNNNPGGEVDIYYTNFPTNAYAQVYAQGDPGSGIGGYDLKSGADQAFPFDYDSSAKADHIALYRPGTGTMWILKNAGGAFSPVYAQGDPGSGIGGYDLKSPADRAFAFDYESSAKADHIALYRPGTGTMWILKNAGGAFSPVYAQGDPGNGIGGYDLKSPTDRAFAFDYDSSGKLDHIVLYRPGTGTMWILKNSGGAFSPVYAQGDPGNGIGGYDLKSAADRAFAFDYDGSGKLDHIALYRPGTGTFWILKNFGGNFAPVYAQGDPGNGIGGYDLKSGADQAFAFDYDNSGKMDHLVLYRPGTGTLWILKNAGGTFSAVYAQGDPGRGVGGYDLLSPADRSFGFDYASSGRSSYLTLYRPGTGTIWILKKQ
jgi:hypothetical protein